MCAGRDRSARHRLEGLRRARDASPEQLEDVGVEGLRAVGIQRAPAIEAQAVDAARLGIALDEHDRAVEGPVGKAQRVERGLQADIMQAPPKRQSGRFMVLAPAATGARVTASAVQKAIDETGVL
jgi:hypothetical protein